MIILSAKIERAIAVAAKYHHGQFRRGDQALPYIMHPFSVAMMLFEYTDDEDVVVAALLHDTLEDTVYTTALLERDFGARVKEIVLTVTEDKQLPWRKQKEGYIKNLKVAGKEALLVAAADKIHNLRSHVDEAKISGAEYWDLFKMSVEEYMWFYGEVLKVLQDRLDSDIVKRLEILYAEARSYFQNKL